MSVGKSGNNNYNRLISSGSGNSNNGNGLRVSVGGGRQMITLDHNNDDDYEDDQMFDKPATGPNNRRPESARVKQA